MTTVLLKSCFLTAQISLKASWGCKQGLEGVCCGRPHQSQWGGSGYTLPAVMHCWWDSQAPLLPPPPAPPLPPQSPRPSSSSSRSAVSLRKKLLQSLAETLTPVQRMHSAHETLHATNGYKYVFKEIPGL